MSDGKTPYTGGCLCGGLRYGAEAAPRFMGHCYCADCRKASGSGFIPFMGFARAAIRFTGESRSFVSKAAHGGDATRNFCPVCGGLVFGGERDRGESFTVYAGTLDDPTLFQPRLAIFTAGRPAWALLPEGLRVFEREPRAAES